jgi:hypothetical protein
MAIVYLTGVFMHPVIQMTVAVMMVVIATRMWPPLLYWLAGIVALLMLVKGVRRASRWAYSLFRNGSLDGLIVSAMVGAGWLLLAVLLDYFLPQKISAVSIVMCFICAYFAIAVIFIAVRALTHRR